MKSVKARKQRKELYNAPLHKKRKGISAHLEENLLLKYDKRAAPVVKGDTVKVMRGSFKGHEDKIAQVNVKKRYIEIEGIFLTKADGKKIAKPVHASNVVITKLNLTDKWRRKKLERGVSEETKKEIEKEGKAQIRELEEEQKQREAEEKARDEAMQAEEEEEVKEELEEPAEEPKKEEKPKSKPAAEKTESKKPAETKPTKKKPTATKPKTKPTAKKTTPKKEEEKKTPSKTKPKKEEEK
jgi:large subunit ribosomal protein L24